MQSKGRIAATVFIFISTSICWAVFGGVMRTRASAQHHRLSGAVEELWGQPHTQRAPSLTFQWQTQREVVRTEQVNNEQKQIREFVTDTHVAQMMPTATRVRVDLTLDERLKGLMWYPLYDVAFDGAWTYRHTQPESGTLTIGFQFPDPQGIYDGFALVVDGQDRSASVRPSEGAMQTGVQVKPGQTVQVRITYKSRGKDRWTYVPTEQVDTLEDFSLVMHTDFHAIDYPAGALSPSSRAEEGAGWQLSWDFTRAVTGRAIGMIMPQRIQPGELASTLAFSAPVSLFFFLLVLMVLSVMRGIDLHPINILFLSGAFFSFHLLFGYSVDHLAIVPAFILSSAVSITLVVSYMRLVVSPRFARVETAAAQLIYLVGFSAAHFFEGFTGLTVTVMGILTLFLLMQLTGRIRWSELARNEVPAAGPDGPRAEPGSPTTPASPGVLA